MPTTRVGALRQRVGRSGLLAAIIAAHALGILWLATRPAATAPPVQPTMSLIEVDAGGPASPAKAPPEPLLPTPDVVPPVILLPSPLQAPSPDTTPAFATPGPAGTGGAAQGGCALAQAAGQAILADPAAMAELDGLPPEARTKADAVMLWDGLWQTPGAFPAKAAGAATSEIRRVVEQIVKVAVPECRDAPELGPQFIPVPGPTRTTFVVIGSGAWRWVDLLRPDDCVPFASTKRCRPTTSAMSKEQRLPIN